MDPRICSPGPWVRTTSRALARRSGDPDRAL